MRARDPQGGGARGAARWGIAWAAVAAAACSSPGGRPLDVAPSGPGEVRSDRVEAHAEQFDDDIGARSAGSQQELAAATYVLGHLQLAGYVVQLVAVPVEDLVRSSDVVALPPGDDDPGTMVLVPIDDAGDGAAIGVFLEVARALRVVNREHDVGFVGLGAEATAVGGGRLGSRRLARDLLDRERRPIVILIGEVESGRSFRASGPRAGEVTAVASALGLRPSPPSSDADDVFGPAGFEHAIVEGDPVAVGEVLLEYLD